ncbi:prephenate dehydrogenase [Reichenbachiella versicolor]|uniref:prephenate dehydrogenase n=1 Tax=Reichenbachiella versicolor TaxID=1821036 RepID=UPI000D6E933B|nr:prephenate dehydrogenase [Reichenbachiella versicolor]
MKVVVVGLGLIGGSAALKLRQTGFATDLVGVDRNDKNADKAVELGLVDNISDLSVVAEAELVLLAIPVTSMEAVLPSILDQIGEQTTVLDLGSTKERIALAVKGHDKRSQFVAGHPIAGTENSGPEAAFAELFEGKTGILCDVEESSKSALSISRDCFNHLGMHLIEMDSKEHDRHIAYVSHISHISSFVLGQTVLEIEKDEASIFNMAGSGFESTVRLAKSSPEMWAPIFKQNKTHISSALEAYIDNLARFKKMIDASDEVDLIKTMREANDIRRVLDGINGKAKNKQLV